jgi:hypothetical protein
VISTTNLFFLLSMESSHFRLPLGNTSRVGSVRSGVDRALIETVVSVRTVTSCRAQQLSSKETAVLCQCRNEGAVAVAGHAFVDS